MNDSTRGTLAQGFDPKAALEFSKHVQQLAKGHQAAAALRDRFGVHLPAPNATQSAGAPGAAGFSPQVQSLLSKLRARGWSNSQVPGVGHVIRHPSGKAFVFHPENGSLTPFVSARG